jgi:mRNA-degrading endonuclease RelE of RelBE toxin-antitoxin system
VIAPDRLHSFRGPSSRTTTRGLALRSIPNPTGATKIEGLEHLYRIREGGYRIIYAIREKDLIVLAVKSSVRREVSRA